ncbi:MAG: flagellar biosynthesis protein FlhF [Proteobacteria bacterium]|nr:flagellar biosynthesis protein FlhF [Pseudomonadota bacterium]
MEPRTYRAKSIQAAIGMIKEEIGKDAVILSTKRIPRGIRNPYGSDLFEVRAIDQKEIGNTGASAVSRLNGATGRRFDLSGEEPSENWHELKNELLHIKEMLFLFGREERFSGILQGDKESLNIYSKLIKAGLSERRARWCVEKCIDRLEKDLPCSGKNNGKDTLSKLVLREIHSFFHVSDPFTSDKNKKCIAAFVGPTGVGKTTTIAKLAAEFSLKKKKRVGLISIDNYRIGALEQLKAYSSIMGIPCIPAFTPEDFQVALKKMRYQEVILVDTAGHSHLDGKGMNELKQFLKNGFPVSNHLVLSANMDREDMRDAVLCFNMLSPESYIFTKLDETRKRCVIIDQAMELKLPISCVTNGQKVPDDIIFATPGKVLKLIFEGDQQMKSCLPRHKNG